MKYAVLKPDQFDDHEVIALIESVPTYNREPRFNETLNDLSKKTAGRDSHADGKQEPGEETITFGDFNYMP